MECLSLTCSVFSFLAAMAPKDFCGNSKTKPPFQNGINQFSFSKWYLEQPLKKKKRENIKPHLNSDRLGKK